MSGYPNLRLLAAAFAFCAGSLAGQDSPPVRVGTTEAVTWASIEELRAEAEAGKPAAQEAYGEALLAGDGTTKDVTRALSYLEKAASAGRRNAAFRLGKLHDDGEVVGKDASVAVRYYTQAALKGVAEAQYNLGAMYVSARGVKRDYREGLAWLIVATKNGAEGDGEAQVRQRLVTTRREGMIADAEARAKELQAQVDAMAKAKQPPRGE